MSDRMRLEALERTVARLQSQVAVRIGPPPVLYTIVIVGGQTLDSSGGLTIYGIKHVSGTLSGITTQTYNPGTCNATTGAETGAPSPGISAWPNGIGFGNLWDGYQWTRAIVVNDGRCPVAISLIGGGDDDTTYVPSNARMASILTSRAVSVTLADSSIISAYSPDLG